MYILAYLQEDSLNRNNNFSYIDLYTLQNSALSLLIQQK